MLLSAHENHVFTMFGPIDSYKASIGTIGAKLNFYQTSQLRVETSLISKNYA